MHIVSVWVIDRIGRPTACDVMEEKSRHVRWTTECLTVPLVAVRDGEPFGDVSVHLRCKVVLVEYVLAVAYQSVLVKPCTTYIVVDVLHATADRNVMLLRGNIAFVHFLEPVGVCPRTSVHRPWLVSGITLPLGKTLVFFLECAVDVVLNLLHDFLVERCTLTIVGSSIVPIACEVVRVGHLWYLRSRRETHIAVVRNTCSPVLTALGCHQDNTKGCA